MKQKFTLITALFIFSIVGVQAQEYYHGVGAQLAYGIFKVEYDGESADGLAPVPGVFYKATYGKQKRRGPGYAVSAYPFVGLAFSTNSRDGGSGSFGFQLPVNAEIYFGDMEENAFFLGGGFSIGYANYTDNTGFLFDYSASGMVFGPNVGIGGQFTLRDRIVGVRLGYTLGLNNTKDLPEGIELDKDSRSMITVGAYYLLGQ